VALVQTVLLVLAIGLSGLSGRYFFKKSALTQMESEGRESLQALLKSLPHNISPDWCAQVSAGSRFHVSVFDQDRKRVCGTSEGIGLSQSEDQLIVTVLVPSRNLTLQASYSLQSFQDSFHLFTRSFVMFLSALGLVLLVVGLWYARKLVFPLGRLLQKTQNLVARHPGVLTEQDLEEEAFGEWSDLESSIDDLGKNLESTVQSLTTEQVELDAIMGSISDAILAVDQEEIPIFYNSRFEMIFGGGKVRRNVKLWEILRDPEILKSYKRALTEGKSGGTRAFSLETENQPKSYFSLSVSPLRRHGGTIYGALGIFHDITELKAAEQMRIDFVANVSHELRTPLTAIKGYTETLILDHEQKGGAESDREYLNIIARNSERLMNLMGDLLELSALESSLLLQKEPLSTREISERVLKQLAPRFQKKNQTAELNVDALSVNADPNRLEQVLINLLDNASKYTPEGGKITVSWEQDRKGGRDTFLKVQDTGPGIPLEHLGRLFERFYRIDKARSREQGGTGLGLAIVKHIMQRHEGAVWVESSPGQGSLFTCRFPG